MAGKVLCEPTELYNILNQYNVVSRLVETNYLCLIDARDLGEYYTGHIMTAKNAARDPEGNFVMPTNVEIDCMKHTVVYDSNASSLSDSGPAIDCADILAKASRYPVKILKGGYEKFSENYPFFRTQKIIYTTKELESIISYPVEILPGRLYMASYRQAACPHILKDLKLNTLINVSGMSSVIFQKENCTVLDIPVADTVEANLYRSFESVCPFLACCLNEGSVVLIFSMDGISRCSALTMAFLMHQLKYTLREAWNHIKQCKAAMRPNCGFVEQLSSWEKRLFGQQITDISEDNF